MVGRIWLIILNTPCTPAGAVDPIAFGPPAPGPRDVGMSGCMVSWVGWLVDWLFVLLVGCKIHQIRGRNSVKLALKTTKLEAKIVGNRSPEASWRGLGGSWRALGLIWAPRELQEPKKSPDGPPTDPPGPPKLGPKIDQKSVDPLVVSI